MAINRRDIIEMLRDENRLLKERNRQVGQKLARHQRAFQIFNQLQQKIDGIGSTDNLPSLLHQMLSLVLHALETENGSLLLIDESSSELEFVEVIGSAKAYLTGQRIPLDTGIVGKTIKRQKSILIENVQKSNDWESNIDQSLDFHTESLLCAPIMSGSKVVGAIELIHKKGESAYDMHDLDMFNLAAFYVSQAMQKMEQLSIEEE